MCGVRIRLSLFSAYSWRNGRGCPTSKAAPAIFPLFNPDKSQIASTAFSCAAFCEYVLGSSFVMDNGVWSCEKLGEVYPNALPFVITQLKEQGIEFTISEHEKSK